MSFLYGMDSCAPIFCTVSAEAAVANLAASIISLPSAIATQIPPQNVSPAAVVSTALTFLDGTNVPVPL